MKTSLLIFFIIFLKCVVDLKQIPVMREANSPVYKLDKVLFIGKIDIYMADRELITQAWKFSFASIIKSHRIFKNVEPLPNDLSKLPTDYLIIDLDIIPKFENEYNWWWTWPAIYPMTGYWPIQKRTGKYNLEILYKITNHKGEELKKGKISKNSEQNIMFYGFFRIHEIEKMIEIANLEAMEECARTLNASF